jgi:hypothetical protein
MKQQLGKEQKIYQFFITVIWFDTPVLINFFIAFQAPCNK